jgi:two-component system chemotaxis sensor kinase CheA
MKIDHQALLDEFCAEAQVQLTALEAGLLLLEKEPATTALLEELFRTAHTFKGNASVMGLSNLVQLAHAVEEALERMLGGSLPASPALLAGLLAAVDEFRQLLAGPATSSLKLVARLEELVGDPDGAPRRVGPTEAPLPSGEAAGRRQYLRVEAKRLDHVVDLLGEITIARARMSTLLDEAARMGLVDAHHDADRLYQDLQEEVMRIRMVPVAAAFQPQIRAIRDLALASGKEVRLEIEGGEVEVDTAVVEALRDPLVHMVRNAVDHGIEAPEVRVGLNKPRCGVIRLRARHEAGRVRIEVSDDGAGLDLPRLRQQGRTHGLLDEGAAEAEVRQLIFHPGLSTAGEVTELSGRGMGMDVVARNVSALRGTIAVESHPGAGTTIALRLPVTLAIIDGFSVGLEGETYVLPLESVVECIELPPGVPGADGPIGVLSLRGHPLPYLRLRHAFQLGGATPARESVVVVRHPGGLAGIAVDALVGQGQAVVKPVPPSLTGLQGISGTTVLGSGRVALILDLEPLLARLSAEAASDERPSAPSAQRAATTPSQVHGGTEC